MQQRVTGLTVPTLQGRVSLISPPALEVNMKLILTPAMLAAAYCYLAETEPLRRWNLPDAEDILFKVGRTKKEYGCCEQVGKKFIITVSTKMHGATDTLMRTMAHEMIHVYQMHHRMRQTSDHDASWQNLAKKVCVHHGFDPKPF